MEYRKVGRGGAGNFYTRQDVEGAQKRAAQDIEAHKSPSEVTLVEQNPATSSAYAHAGRGGAGNLTDKAALTKSTARTIDVTPSLQERRPSEHGRFGRGGAGNFSDEPPMETAAELRRASVARARADQDVVQEVESQLETPQRAHLGQQKLDYNDV